MVNDYMDGKRKPKNPDPLGPPITYMEECEVFQPLASTTNTLGLCRFYHVRTLTCLCLQVQSHWPLADHVKKLLFLASTKQRWYVIVVFQGGTVTPLGLLQELHTRSALVSYPYLPDWGSQGRARCTCMSCCPFCMYTVQNDTAYLNHIVCMHNTMRVSHVGPALVP